MTKKDYILIAEAIVKQYKNLPESTRNLNGLIDPFIMPLKLENASFDISKFEKYIRSKLP